MPIGGTTAADARALPPALAAAAAGPQGAGASAPSPATAATPTGFDPVAAGADQGAALNAAVARAAAAPTGRPPAAAPAAAPAAPTAAGAAPAAGQTNIAAADPANPNDPLARPPQGPAAWNDRWHRKFVDIGTPPDIMQSLTFSGAGGADEAQLKALHAKIGHMVTEEIAAFRKKHPEEAKQLEAKLKRPELMQIILMSKTGQLTDSKLKEAAKNAGMTPGKMYRDMVFKMILPWTFIPGWGAIRYGASFFNGGKDPLSGEKIEKNPTKGFQAAMDLAFAVGGATSIFNTVRGMQSVRQGMRIAAGGGPSGIVGETAAQVAAREGLTNLKGFDKVKAFWPHSDLNHKLTGIARLNGDLASGLEKLKYGTNGQMGTRDLAELYLRQLGKGEFNQVSKSGFGMLPFGLGSEVRGALPIISHRGKALQEWKFINGKPASVLDGRMGGQSLAAHMASAGVNLAPSGALKAPNSALMNSAAGIGPNPLGMMQRQVLGQAAAEMGLKWTGLAATPFGKAWSAWRPGPMADAINAMRNPNATPSAIGKAFQNKWVRNATIATGAGGAMALYQKSERDKALKEQAEQKKAQAEFQKSQQAAAGQQPGGAGGADPAEQAELQQFLALPPEQQQAMLETTLGQLQQAGANPQLTEQQKAQVEQGYGKVKRFAEAAQAQAMQAAAASPAAGGMPGVGAGAEGAMSGAASLPAGATAPGAMPTGQPPQADAYQPGPAYAG